VRDIRKTGFFFSFGATRGTKKDIKNIEDDGGVR
jgi:hypothetical protein